MLRTSIRLATSYLQSGLLACNRKSWTVNMEPPSTSEVSKCTSLLKRNCAAVRVYQATVSYRLSVYSALEMQTDVLLASLASELGRSCPGIPYSRSNLMFSQSTGTYTAVQMIRSLIRRTSKIRYANIHQRLQPMSVCNPLSSASHSVASRLWRSFFYVPGDKPRMIEKISQLPTKLQPDQFGMLIPDLIVLDCEDAVGIDRKAEARQAVSDALSAPEGGLFRVLRQEFQRTLIVRINDANSRHAIGDLAAVLDAAITSSDSSNGIWPGPDLFCLPKVESLDALSWLSDRIDAYLSKATSSRSKPQLGLVAMIESCKSIVNLPDICREGKSLKIPLVGVVFGSDDYCVSLVQPPDAKYVRLAIWVKADNKDAIDIDGLNNLRFSWASSTHPLEGLTEPEWDIDISLLSTMEVQGVDRSPNNVELSYARSYVPVVAKAFGLSSIDMVDIDYKDTEKLEENCKHGAQMGFSGKQTIHPAQLPIVNKAFSPSSARIEWSRDLLVEAEKHSEGDAVGAEISTPVVTSIDVITSNPIVSAKRKKKVNYAAIHT
ncbi:citrate lyase subunit beta-like protein [Clonorchis sinensis]|uniref:Citrate lyase subunit beta-like protein n=1 Tax=Clonorchis sinensis TaxID=79923 RepID=G7YAH4_CLOSI|nr:citrate lyase subunit beta-like protein [Clonorchis sinensis]